PGPDRRQIEHPVRVGRIQHLFARLQDLVDITRHQPEPLTQPRRTVIPARNHLAPGRSAMYTRLSSRMPLLLGGRAYLSLKRDSSSRFGFLMEHDLFGKPLTLFRIML